VLGVDVLEEPLAVARSRHGRLAPRLRFGRRSVFGLELPGRSFDLTVCRHVLQSIPNAAAAVAELARVTRLGGWVHLIAEDYGMVHFPPRQLDPADFWPDVPRRFGRSTGTDMLIGRKMPGILRRLGLTEIQLDLALVDTIRVPREVFADTWTAWRDGYSDAIGTHTSMSADLARRHFDDQIASLRDPESYAIWMVPILGARVPDR
jgi:SAM-dependent methyltransferase